MDMNKVVKDTTKTVLDIRALKTEAQEKIYASLEKLIKGSEEIFKIINDYQTEFLSGEEKHMSFYYNAQDRLTGCYDYLSPIATTLKGLVKFRESRYFHEQKLSCEKIGGKFVQGATEREAENFVGEENLVLTVFEGFKDSCNQSIQTCRSRIREIEEKG